MAIMTVRTGKNTAWLPKTTIRSKQKRKSAVIEEIAVKKKGGGLEFCGSKTAARMPRLKVPIKTAMT